MELDVPLEIQVGLDEMPTACRVGLDAYTIGNLPVSDVPGIVSLGEKISEFYEKNNHHLNSK